MRVSVNNIGAAVRGFRTALVAVAAAMIIAPSGALAAASVSWTSPADGSTFPVGTSVSPLGQASASGATGGGLDLALVMDSSGSMGARELVDGSFITRQQAQKDALIALVNSLPADTTSISVIEFDSDASTVQTLLPLTPASNKSAIIAAINSVDASGGTFIGSGIQEATSDLVTNGDPTRSQQMVVLSDGSTAGNPAIDASDALTAGIDAVNSVALPGANISTMQSIAAAGSGTFIDVSSDLGALVGEFTGSGGGTPVGLDKVEVTAPDGTITEVTVDLFGNFASPAFALAAGPNLFSATAFATDGSTATAQITLFGGDSEVIPLPAAAWMFMAGLAGIGAIRRRRA